jgi:cellulose synthase/poly-beta-1,6-N-acetylglucosamine synthase-like glycosyltransferase
MSNPDKNLNSSNKTPFSKSSTAMSTPEFVDKANSAKIYDVKKEKKQKIDFVQVVLAASIFAFLGGMIYFILGPISMVAMSIGGVLSIYHMFSNRTKRFSKDHKGRRAPSILLLVLIGSPFLMGGLVAYEGFSLLESPSRILLLWAMTISFWTTMLFVPMSVMSKHKENLQTDLTHYPKVSVIVPAYNEEKVIQKTLESMIETKYPRKEILFVDDGSKDRTLEIAKQFKKDVIVLHKENGGKASALNYEFIKRNCKRI